MEISFEQMSLAERILYVQDLWDRIAIHPDAGALSDAHRVELRRRLADHELHPEASVDWQTARERIRVRL